MGINTDKAEDKRNLTDERRREITYRRRLKRRRTSTEQKLAFHYDKIQELEEQKKTENYNEDIEKLNQVKYNLNRTSSE